MYLRTTTRRAGDGTAVRYVQLAHNRRVNGVTRAQVLVNLGREDQLDREALRRLMSSIGRWLGDGPDGDGAGPLAALRVLDVRPLGSAWLLDGLWKALGIDAALAEGADRSRWTDDTERIAFAAALARATAPDLVPALHLWVGRLVHVPGLDTLTPDEVPAVGALVAATDLDVRLAGLASGGPAAPQAAEAFRSSAERVGFGESVLGWLAGLLVRTVEERTGLPWAFVRSDLDRIAAVTVAGPYGTMTTATEPADDHRALFAACGVDLPPAVLALALT